MIFPEVAKVEALLAELAREAGDGTCVLEAGCGRFKHFAYPEGMAIAGLDISPDQLARNDYAAEKFLGDVQTFRLERQFDAVVSVFVLEHLADPAAALDNMLAWTRPGGLLILAVPNVLSLKGLVTKFTPFWFHHLAYRVVYRRPYSIFPTTLRWSIAPRALRRRFAGHEIVLELTGTETVARPFGLLYDGLNAFLRAVTLGRWRPELSNYLLVVRKTGTREG